MSEKGLREICKNAWEKYCYFKFSKNIATECEPWIHCHHLDIAEQKPKEKCWCEFDPDVRHGRLSIGIDTHYTFPSWKFCPVCGRKLDAK